MTVPAARGEAAYGAGLPRTPVAEDGANMALSRRFNP
ncbi:hypothetical protein QFZ74_002666 [Streptomyces sp. V3I7]|nr:hypothetical protein [Streptomyces sp. V3I7]